MKLVTATFRLYLDAIRDALRAFVRSAWALVVLLVAFPILLAAGVLLSPLGIVGGMLVALLADACAGTYLACLQDALTTRKSMSLAVVRSNLGTYTWDIVGIQFPLFVVDFLLLSAGLTAVAFVVTAAVFLACNPAPEMLGRARSGGVELLREAGRFMLQNGIEWFVGQLPFFAAIAALGGAMAIAGFGPRFEFVTVGGEAFQGVAAGPAAWVTGLGVVALAHLTMLFRSALFVRLSAGGRRARAWQESFR